MRGSSKAPVNSNLLPLSSFSDKPEQIKPLSQPVTHLLRHVLAGTSLHTCSLRSKQKHAYLHCKKYLTVHTSHAAHI